MTVPVVAVPAGTPKCLTADLSVALTGTDGAAGTFFAHLAFHNNAGSLCEMTGFPGVSFLDAAGTQINVPAQRARAHYRAIGVAAGATVYSQLAFPDPDGRGCPVAIAQFVRVYPPNQRHTLLIRIDATNSSGTPDGIRLCASGGPPAIVAPVVATPPS